MSYEDVYGKVRLQEGVVGGSYLDVHGRSVPSAAAAVVVHDADGHPLPLAVSAQGSGMPSQPQPHAEVPPLRSYAEWYSAHRGASGGDGEGGDPSEADDYRVGPIVGSRSLAGRGDAYSDLPLHAVVTAEHFKQLSRDGGRRREADLWSLVEDILLDAERSARYEPEAIGIAATQPQRRWYITHYAHIQDLLMRHPTLRRACIICSWLERTYRDTQRQPRLRGDEDVVLRQLLLTYLRGGQLGDAIAAAVRCEDSSYSCVLSAAQLQTTHEPWLRQTALVPLFGEYAHGQLDQAWTGNEHRLDNLCQLYEDSQQYARPESGPRHGFDAVIGAALCGNLAVLEPAFLVSNNWRDVAWCALRCALTVAFSKTLMDAGIAVEGEAYRTFLERQTGSEDDWVPGYERRLVANLTQRLTTHFIAKAPVEEQMQMRFILQVLSPDDASFFNVTLPAPTTEGPDWGSEARSYREAVRIFTHLLLVLDAAYNETLSPHAVQAYSGEALAKAMAEYAAFLAVLPRFPFDQGMVAMVAMARRLRDYRHRAAVYAAFLRAAREYELERQTLSRERLEEQEAQLVRLFVEADTDPEVHAEVQRLLNQQVPLGELLTHNRIAEQILWEAMHAVTPDDYVAVLRRGLEACAEFWLTQPAAELEAIADVSRILACRVVGFLAEHAGAAAGEGSQAEDGREQPSPPLPLSSSSPSPSLSRRHPPMTDDEAREATFWYRLSEARRVATKHARIAGELGAARAQAVASALGKTSADRTLLYLLAQDEVLELRRLTEMTQQALRQGGAAVRRVPDAVSAISWLLQQLCENVGLSLLNSNAERDELALVQSVFALLEELDEAGYLDPAVLPRLCAEDLYRSVRTVRVAYGQRAHRRHVMAALAKSQAAVGLGGGAADRVEA